MDFVSAQRTELIVFAGNNDIYPSFELSIAAVNTLKGSSSSPCYILYNYKDEIDDTFILKNTL
jgi:hypothetical protein